MSVSVRPLAAVLLLAALGHAPGCSWIFVQPLPRNYEYGPVNCTTNRAAPVIDTLFTATNIVSAAYVAGQDNVTNKGSAVAAGLSVATLWMLSAIYGYSHTAECEEAMEDSTPYRPSHRAMPPYQPPPYQPPPTPYLPPTSPPVSPPPQASPPQAGETPTPPAPAAVAPAPPAPLAPQQGDDEDPKSGHIRPAPPPRPEP